MKRFTTVYSVAGGSIEGVFYVPTLAEARRIAQEMDAEEGNVTPAYITRSDVAGHLPRRTLVCRLLNGESWSIASEEIAR